MNRAGSLVVAALVVASAACSSGGSGHSTGAAGAGGGAAAAGGGAAGVGGGNAKDAGAGGVMPTVVASFGAVPASMALSGSTLYVTIAETGGAANGKVVSVAKTASDAQPDAGMEIVLASGLKQPRAIAVNGGQVLWADTEAAFPGLPAVFDVAANGTGTPTEIFSNVYTLTRLAISGSVLYGITSDLEVIDAYPLAGADGGVGRTVYPGSSPKAVQGPDSDGTSVFFFTPGATNSDLYRVGADGTGLTDLVVNATSGSTNFDYIVDDDADVFWSDAGTGSVFSVSKTATAGATPKLLATPVTGSAPVQLALDGNNIYLLSSYQLLRIPKAGGTTPAILASVSGGGSDIYLASLGNAVALAVDDTFVYWLYEGHGQILKIAK